MKRIMYFVAALGLTHNVYSLCCNQNMVNYSTPDTWCLCNHWYIGGNMGLSRTHDRPIPGSGNSVTQIGPGWNVDAGYQFAKLYHAILSGEVGYTQYHNSSETVPAVVLAKTEHYAVYAAAVGQYPLFCHFNLVGKLGIAYSYAQKIFTATGASASASAYSPYYGLGLSYNASHNVALIAQWARAKGNSGTRSTGSTDLSSLGMTYSFG